MVSLHVETLTPQPDEDSSNKTGAPLVNETITPKGGTIKMESSMKDDKKPEESLNSGENHVKDALSDLKSFDARENKNVAAFAQALTTKQKDSKGVTSKEEERRLLEPKTVQLTPVSDQQEETKRSGSARP